MEEKEYLTRMNKAVYHIEKAMEVLEGTEEGDTDEIRKKNISLRLWEGLEFARGWLKKAIESKKGVD